MRLPRRTDPVVDRATQHGFELAAALMWALVGLAFFIDPTKTLDNGVIGARLWPMDFLWEGLFLVGGVMTTVGLLLPSSRFRVAGLLLLATGLGITFIVAMARHPEDPRFLVYGIYAIAALVRGRIVYRTLVGVPVRSWPND